MKKSIATLLGSSFLLFNFAYADEPSAYGAGDLQSSTPYGLTSEEKVLLETKKNLEKVKVKTNTQENKVNSLRERIDGLQTIIEGLTRRNHENKIAISRLKEMRGDDNSNLDKYEKRVEALVVQNSADLQKVQEHLEELNATITGSYATKAQLQEVVDSLNMFKKLVAEELKQIGKNQPSSLDKLSKATILKKARAYYNKKQYTKAITYYKYLLAHNYKPARSSYMLGEIYYYKRDYANAIAYFKESAKRYPKASYMPTLMLHTAVAMKKTGDKNNANAFFKALVKKYPSSKEAKAAKKYF